MRSLHLTSLFAVGFIGYGCSVINAPEDVVPQGSTSGASTGATGATQNVGGKTGGGGAPDDGGTTAVLFRAPGSALDCGALWKRLAAEVGGRGGGRADRAEGRLAQPVADWPGLIERLVR